MNLNLKPKNGRRNNRTTNKHDWLVVIFKYIKAAFVFIIAGLIFWFGNLFSENKWKKKEAKKNDKLLKSINDYKEIDAKNSKLTKRELIDKL